eukprot:5350470-Alexandrium_andersonii.AAC.1
MLPPKCAAPSRTTRPVAIGLLRCAALPPSARLAVPPRRRAVPSSPARLVEIGLLPWHCATQREAPSLLPVPPKGPLLT